MKIELMHKVVRLVGKNCPDCLTEALIMERFKLGYIVDSEFDFNAYVMECSDGYNLLVRSGRGIHSFVSTIRQPTERKVYRTVSGALSSAKKLGFDKAVVYLP